MTKLKDINNLQYIFIIIGISVFFTGCQETRKSSVLNNPVEVTFHLSGMTVPGKIIISPAENSFHVLYEGSDKSIKQINLIDSNAWAAFLEKDKQYIIGWISEQMFGYVSAPFTASEGLTVDFSPGMPAVVEYEITAPPDSLEVFPLSVSLMSIYNANGKDIPLNFQNPYNVDKPGIIKIQGLAKGRYQVRSINQYWSNPHIKRFSETRYITLKSGRVHRLMIQYPLPDITRAPGDVTIKGLLLDKDKMPLTNRKVFASVNNSNSYYYLPAITDKQGIFEFDTIAPDQSVNISFGNVSASLKPDSLQKNGIVNIDLVYGLESIEPATGKQMIEVIFQKPDGSSGLFEDFRSKHLIIDVWATWCPYCKRAMPRLNELAGSDKWKDKVSFLSISVDDDRQIWEKMLKEKKWENMTHGWFDPKANSHKFKKPIPYYIILDKEGKVIMADNGINIEKYLDDLTR